MMKVRPLSKELQRKSEKELNENPKNIKADIEHIREWLKKQPHLIDNPNDQFILTFLRGCKFNYQTTKQKLDAFYTTKTLVPQYLRNRNPLAPDVQRILKTARFWLPLPKFSDPLAPRLFLHHGKPYETSEAVDLAAFVKTVLIILDILLREDDSFIINGYSVIQFAKGANTSNLSQITLKMCKDAYTCMIKRYPLRLKKMHFMNVPSSVYILFNIAKPFLSRKLLSRISFYECNDYEELHASFPKKELPVELGGESYSVSTVLSEWITKIQSHSAWLIEDENLCSDEAKRIGNANFTMDGFGVEGSFKKLEID